MMYNMCNNLILNGPSATSDERGSDSLHILQIYLQVGTEHCWLYTRSSKKCMNINIEN